jgi:ribosomal protein S18 acetylase RimI-like enzyme
LNLGSHIATIFSVYVIPEIQNKGIAHKLLETLIKKLDSCKSIIKANLVVNPQQKSAYKLYSHLGFHVVGFLEKELYTKNQYHDLYLMTKFL